jgi:hypothetical protein
MAKDTKEPEVLQIPCTLFRVTTQTSGGHRLMFDSPEVAATQVKELIGTENKQNYILCLVKVDKDSKPCQPSRKQLIFKKSQKS